MLSIAARIIKSTKMPDKIRTIVLLKKYPTTAPTKAAISGLIELTSRKELSPRNKAILFLPHLVKMLRRGHVFFSTQVIEIMTRELSIAPRKYTLHQNYFVHDPSLSRLKSHSHTISLFYCFCKTLHIWQSILEIVRTHFAAKGGGGQKSEKSEPQF